MKKRFIEWDLPLAEISEESAREKNIRHGHPSTLHIWWARRPLASSRATNFAALIDLPDDLEKRKEITELIKKITPWDAVKNGNDENIKKAQQMIKEQWGDQPPRVLDPFAGGGSIPLEALRLGCETYVNDYNPVAVFIEKATLEWPQKFGVKIPHPDKKPGIDGEVEKVNFLSYMVDKWAKIILERVKEEIGNFYPEEPDGSIPVAYIWAKTIPCQNPSCKVEIPLIKQFWLSKKDKKNIAYKYVINNDNKIEFEIIKIEHDDFDSSESTVSRADARCLVCGQITNANLTRQLFKNGKMGERLIVIVLQHPERNEKIFRIATKKDIDDFCKAKKYLEEKVKNWPWLDNPIPKEKAPPEGHRSCSNAIYGLDTWDKFYNPRQMLALITFVDKIKAIYEEIKENCRSVEIEKLGFDYEEAAKAIVGYLGIIQSRCSDFCNTFVLGSQIGNSVVISSHDNP